MGVLLMGSGVPMTFDGAAEVTIVEKDGDGKAQTQKIARGPVAAIIPIKHLGTNGGGFFGANSAHPFENPTALTNFLTCVNFMLFPFAVVICFGRMLGNPRQATVIYGVMLSLLLFLVGWSVYWDTLNPNPGLAGQDGQVYAFDVRQPDGTVKQTWLLTTPGQSPEQRVRSVGEAPPVAASLVGLPVDTDLGNLEGKELRFGTSAGATFAALTTAIACGSVNCSHDSLNPLCGLSSLTGMWLNCIFGGKGVGLVNLLVYLITGVFLSGLMVGRTPEYLGKKVEAREMKLAMLALLIHPILSLGPPGLFAATNWGMKSTSNPGAHGFSEILYEFASASANNGSEFGGLQQTYGFHEIDPASPPAPYSPYWDVATGLVMLIGRLIPIIAPCARRWLGGETADTLYRRYAAHGYAYVCVRATGNDPARWRPAVFARGRARPDRRTPGPCTVWWMIVFAGTQEGSFGTAARINTKEHGTMSTTIDQDAKIARRQSRSMSLFAPELLRSALKQAFLMLRPDVQWKNPVMFVVEVGTVLSIIFTFAVMFGYQSQVDLTYLLALDIWLFLTVLFANFASALAEARGKAQADALRKTRQQTPAFRLRDDGQTEQTDSTSLKAGDKVVVIAGQVIPGDGEIIEGVASVDESAITGESAPVIREAGGDRSGVTGGTRVLSDRLVVRITAGAGASFLDRMIALVEGATRQRTPNEIALSLVLSAFTLIFLIVTAALWPMAWYAEQYMKDYLGLAEPVKSLGTDIPTLVALLVCLIPTTIGALLAAIGIAGMDRALRRT